MRSTGESTAGNRQKLIEATIELMSSRGFESMGIHSILEAAGVTKSNFYYHFKSKEELCLASLQAMEEHFFGNYLDPIMLDQSLSPRERLQKLFGLLQNKMTTGCCEKRCPFVNLATETSDFLPAFREKIDAFFSRYLKRLADCYREGVDCGEFRADVKPETAALTILAGINGMTVLTKVQRNPQIIEESARTMLALLASSKN
jgi:TetR/AcrR family transcriptional regulator, transcriptional repressor for nem operon